MALSCTVFGTFDTEKYCDLEIRVMGRLSKLVTFDRLNSMQVSVRVSYYRVL